MKKELTLKLLEDTQDNLSKAIGGMLILGLDTTKAVELAKEYTEAREQLERDSEEELKKLDKAIRQLGYKDRADWYRDMKRQTIKEAEKQSK